MQRLNWEQRSCGCGAALLVKPGSVNPHNDWCLFCCQVCARQEAEAPLRFSGASRAYGGA
jgi:hypothetical protein